MTVATKPTMEQLLRVLSEQGGTDLHLAAGLPPYVRIDDQLTPTEFAPLSREEVQEIAYSVLAPEQIERYEREKELDFAFSVDGLARFRGNYFVQKGCVGAAIRILPFRIPTFEELGLPPIVTEFCNKPKGLLLVTGATGAGKSTTLAAMVNYLNYTKPYHILTIEDPIEYVHTSQKALINQREVGDDTHSFGKALKYTLRQDPDVILVGEMRDLETIEAALTMAETGHLVLATLHTSDAVSTANRIIDAFPSHQQSQVRVQLSMELLGVLSQQLVPRASGRGRVLALEVLTTNHAVRSLIREQKLHQLYSVIQTGQKEGMRTMNQSLYELYTKRVITLEAAVAKSVDPDELLRLANRPAS